MEESGMPGRSMTKSPMALAQAALQAASAAMPAYSCPKSRHDYTQHQLFACLVLKDFFRTDFRGIVQMLAEWSDLRQAIGLEKVPHPSTLCYARDRFLKRGASFSCWGPSSGWPVRGGP
jgi:hypothetical protein